MNLDQRLTEVGGRPTGFDYMRIILSCAVIGWHSVVTTYGPAFQDAVQQGWWRSLIGLILPMFFALSGFLVAGSLERCKTLVSFLGLRFIRIYPALTVEVFLSAFLLGPLVTVVPLSEYFTDGQFFRYLVNVTGHITFELPGVFLSNPNPERVNGQLWTVPYELYCYAAIAGLAALGLARRRTLFLLAVAGLWAAAAAFFYYRHGLGGDRPPTGMPGPLLVISFLCGIAIYLWRDRLPWSAPMGLAAGALGAWLMGIPVFGDFLAPVPVAYFTVWLGLCNPRKLRVLQGADYSYGIFLYGYVIQQAYMSIGPAVQHWAINILLALPTAAVFAALSWHFVEKPALRLRTPLKRLEEAWMGYRKRFLPLLPGPLRPPERVEKLEV